MFKDLLVPLIDAPGDAAALEAAFALARMHEGHVAALIVVPLYLPPAFEWGAMPGDLYASLHAEARAHAAGLAAATRARTAAIDVPFELRVVETEVVPAARTAALHARHADLAVLAAAPDDAGRRAAQALFLDLLLDAGRPVLHVPGPAVLPPRRVVVAWQPTREAARALHDALPLLQRAQRVDVLSIDPVVDEHRHGELPGADIGTHLARHGCNVEVIVRPRQEASVGRALLRHVQETGADLVVAGGYSHTRLREQWLGGVTRTLYEESPVPVLFSH